MSGFPEKGLTSGEVRETSGNSGELPGKSGKLPGNPWIAVKFRSERTSGEVAEKLPGKFGELPGKSGGFPEARRGLTPSQRLAKFVTKKGVLVWSVPRPAREPKGPSPCKNTPPLLLLCSAACCLCARLVLGTMSPPHLAGFLFWKV